MLLCSGIIDQEFWNCAENREKWYENGKNIGGIAKTKAGCGIKNITFCLFCISSLLMIKKYQKSVIMKKIYQKTTCELSCENT